MLKNLKNFNEKSSIFIDANIFLHHAFNSNDVSKDFLNKIEVSNIKAYTSALALEEVFYKLLMQSASNFLSKVTQKGVKNLLNNSEKKANIFKAVYEYMGYIQTLKDFGLTILDLTFGDIQLSVQKANTYSLITADSAHLATMGRKGIVNIASNDNDFKKVTNIVLWSPIT